MGSIGRQFSDETQCNYFEANESTNESQSTLTTDSSADSVNNWWRIRRHMTRIMNLIHKLFVVIRRQMNDSIDKFERMSSDVISRRDPLFRWAIASLKALISVRIFLRSYNYVISLEEFVIAIITNFSHTFNWIRSLWL